MWQARRVKDLLTQKNPAAEIEIVAIQTTGDKILDKPLVQLGGKGIFTKEIEKALIDRTIDFAVHSYKDLPTRLPQGLDILCIPERESPFDALISRSGKRLSELPDHPTIATGSLRRKAQVLAIRPDAAVIDIRGNVNTRMKKFDESDWDAMIMAEAGLLRMEWSDRIAGVLSLEEMIPAPAQGALAIEGRADDSAVRELLETIHNPTTSIGVIAERTFLAHLEGGCQVPIAAHAVVDEQTIHLFGLIATLDGERCVRVDRMYPAGDSIQAGNDLARTALEQGGHEIIETLKHLQK